VSLRHIIEQEIGAHGPIPFSRYRSCACTIPSWVTTRVRQQFGKAGDFYTSADVHAVFGRLLARQSRKYGGPRLACENRDFGTRPRPRTVAQDVLVWSEKKFPEFSTPCTTRWRRILLSCGTDSGACLQDFWRVESVLGF